MAVLLQFGVDGIPEPVLASAAGDLVEVHDPPEFVIGRSRERRAIG